MCRILDLLKAQIRLTLLMLCTLSYLQHFAGLQGGLKGLRGTAGNFESFARNLIRKSGNTASQKPDL